MGRPVVPPLVAVVAVVCAVATLALAAGARAQAPACLGAQALDPARACAPGRAVIADLQAGADRRPCRPVGPAFVQGCRFGVAPARARRRMALLGDSHAQDWRPALDAVARARRWSIVSLAQPGCFFSAAVRALPAGARELCTEWYDAALAYLRARPAITTALVSSSVGWVVSVAPGQTLDTAKARGFRRAYRALPASVTRVVAIRDRPLNTPALFDCQQATVAAGTDTNALCPLPRASGLGTDAAVTAARGLRSPRYRVVDLSDLFCAGPACLSVVGGVQVYRDGYGHISDLYSATLGPYLARALAPLLPAA